MSFQPFVVQCLTCGSQLRVNDPAIVGTIAACPKCNSMVQIERPGHQVAVGSSNIDSQAITEEAIPAAEGSLLETAAPTASGFVGEASEDEVTRNRGAEPIPPDWQSDQTRRRRQIALVVAVSITGLLVAIAGFSWFVKSWQGQQPITEVTPADASTPNAPTPNAPRNETTDAVIPQTGAPSSPETDWVEPKAIESDPEKSDSDPSSTDPDDTSANVEDNPPSAQGVPSSPDNSADATNASARSLLSDLIPTSPLDLPPSNVPPPPPAQMPGDSSDDEASQTAGLQELPPELAKYTQFLLEEGPTEKPTLQAPPTMDDITIEAAADELDDPTITVRPKEVNLKADLAVRMALDTKGYPPSRLVLLISQITGVPIQVDWVSFDLSGIDLDAPITPPQGWKSAREILDTLAENLSAEVREEESLVILTVTDEAFDGHLASLIDLSDFADHQETAKQVLIDFLRSDGDEAGDDIPLGLSREDRQIAGIAADVLRRMRGVKPKVDDSRLNRWSWCSNDSKGQWMPLSGGEVLAQPDTPITMADFLRRMAAENNASNLVNWYDFQRRAVPPEHLLLPHIEADAGMTMQRVLGPLGLQARQVDGNHWWIGRESTYDRLPAIIWTPPLGDQRDRFVEELANVMQGATRDAFRLTIDPHSDRALLLLPRFVVRQLTRLADGIAAN